jgi:hypothetical protein
LSEVERIREFHLTYIIRRMERRRQFHIKQSLRWSVHTIQRWTQGTLGERRREKYGRK